MTGIIDPLERPCCFLAAATPPCRLIVSQNAIPRGVRIDSRRRRRKIAPDTIAFPSRSYSRSWRERGRTRSDDDVFPDKKGGKYRLVVKLNGMRRCNFYTRYADRAIKNFIPRWMYGCLTEVGLSVAFIEIPFVPVKSFFLPLPL